MNKTLALLTAVSTFGMADMIGGELNLGYYNHAPSGTAQYQGDTIDAEKDLKWSATNDIFVKAYFEHPILFLPNVKVGYTDFSHTGSGNVNTAFTFGNERFDLNTNIDSSLDLTMYDLTLYYEILDNWVNADVGLNVKYVDGKIAVNSNSASAGTDFQVPIPMLYAKARFDVPTTDLSFQAEGNYVTYDGHTLYDAEIGVRYTFALGLGLEGGYKTMKLKLDNIDDFTMDTDFSGAYGKLVWDF